MYALTALMRKSFHWWFRLCTGREEPERSDEEQHRLRILVLVGAFWLGIVLTFMLTAPFALDFTDGAQLVVGGVFAASFAAVAASMTVLRFTGNRLLAVNVLLLFYVASLGGACCFTGGSASPTYPLLLLVPALAALAGSIRLSVVWSLIVIAFWLGVIQAERSGLQFQQLYPSESLGMAMMMSYTGLTLATLAVVIIYAETTSALREQLLASNTELAHLSSHDQLTRLPNRRFYDQRIGHALHRAQENRGITGLLYIDLNGFKKINDTHGHGAGDKLLITVAQRIQASLRETDLVARLGGDEFVVVLEDLNSPDEIALVAHKLSEAIGQPLLIRSQVLRFSASVGVAIYPQDGQQRHELEDKADKAMYLAKKQGLPVALASLGDEQPGMLRPVRNGH